MAEVLASLKKIGGSEQYTETVLWTNSSPTSNFSAQTVTLSDSISNYKYIGVLFDCDVSASGQPRNTAIYSVADYKTTRYNGNTDHNICSLAFQGKTNNYMYARMFYYVDDTHIGVSSGMNVQRTGGFDSVCVPLQIIGLNELAHAKGLDEITTLWTNSSPASSFATQTITLSDEISDYDFIKIVWAISTSETSQYQGVYFIPADTFANYLQAKNRSVGNLGMSNTSDYAYTRNVFYASDTSIKFGNCYRVGTTTQANTICIPISVIGCRFK